MLREISMRSRPERLYHIAIWFELELEVGVDVDVGPVPATVPRCAGVGAGVGHRGVDMYRKAQSFCGSTAAVDIDMRTPPMCIWHQCDW